MNEENNEIVALLTIIFNVGEKIDSFSKLRNNLGFFVLSYFYHKLNIDKILLKGRETWILNILLTMFSDVSIL